MYKAYYYYCAICRFILFTKKRVAHKGLVSKATLIALPVDEWDDHDVPMQHTWTSFREYDDLILLRGILSHEKACRARGDEPTLKRCWGEIMPLDDPDPLPDYVQLIEL